MAEVEQMTAKALEKRERREKKRVRFSGDQDSDGEDDTPKEAMFPKGKKAKEKVAVTPLAEGQADGPILAADPRVAAKARATRRRDDASFNDETGILDDVAGAEEEFEGKDDDEMNDIEPFNLKKEREDGYFDAEGNYVEYRNENDFHDAWLDSVDVDTRFAEKAGTRAAALESEPSSLSSAEEAVIKRRIADSLELGETVLQALKRLGGDRSGKGPGRGGNKGRASKEQRMPDGQRQLFDRLTEDAMRLMDNGEYGVYSETKETFVREAEGLEALKRARSGPSKGGSDMFADSDSDDGDEPPAKVARIAPANGAMGPVAGMAGGNPEQVPAPDGPPASAAEQGHANGDAPGGTTQANANSNGENGASGAPSEESGYTYDPSSGYYYNSDVGYYYDANTGLYCSASTGLWYRFDATSNSYFEVSGG